MSNDLKLQIKSYFDKETSTWLFNNLLINNNDKNIKDILTYMVNKGLIISITDEQLNFVKKFFMRYFINIYCEYKKDFNIYAGAFLALNVNNINKYLNYLEASNFIKGNLD